MVNSPNHPPSPTPGPPINYPSKIPSPVNAPPSPLSHNDTSRSLPSLLSSLSSSSSSLESAPTAPTSSPPCFIQTPSHPIPPICFTPVNTPSSANASTPAPTPDPISQSPFTALSPSLNDKLITVEKHRKLREKRKCGKKTRVPKSTTIISHENSLTSTTVNSPASNSSTTPPYGPGPAIANMRERRALWDQLDREVRWNSFLFHSHCFMDETIRKIYGNDISVEHSLYRAARFKFYDTIKVCKKQVLENAHKHILDLIADNSTCHVRDLYDKSQLQSFFQQSFSVSNFFRIWLYMRNYFDLTSSGDIAEFWCRSLYTNICTMVKLCSVDKPGNVVARKDLLAFYDALPTYEDYESVSRSDFFELHERTRCDRSPKVQNSDETILKIFFSALHPIPQSSL